MRISPWLRISEEWKYAGGIQEEKCCIVHCSFYKNTPVRIRIWKKRIQLVQDNGASLRLLEVVNVHLSFWKTFHPVAGCCCFMLVFEPLDANCKKFRIIENLGPLKTLYALPIQGSFYSEHIERNPLDAYKVILKRGT